MRLICCKTLRGIFVIVLENSRKTQAGMSEEFSNTQNSYCVGVTTTTLHSLALQTGVDKTQITVNITQPKDKVTDKTKDISDVCFLESASPVKDTLLRTHFVFFVIIHW